MLVKRLAAYTHFSSTISEIQQVIVENCDVFIPHLCLAAPHGVTPSEFREDLDIHKTRMNGLSCGEESMTICSVVSRRRNTSGRATGPKCKLMLTISPESVHKKLDLIAPVFFELWCNNSKVVTRIRSTVDIRTCVISLYPRVAYWRRDTERRFICFMYTAADLLAKDRTFSQQTRHCRVQKYIFAYVPQL